MKIAIFGSCLSDPDIGDVDSEGVASFCRELGKRLAHDPHQILVESDRPRTADRSVIDGVLSAETIRAHAVVYFRHERVSTRPFAAEAHANPSIFRAQRLSGKSLSPAHIRMIQDADVAVVVGGRSHSYLAGLAAAYMSVRVIPIATLGGAGGRLWEQLTNLRSSRQVKVARSSTWNRLGAEPAEALNAVVREIESLPRLMIVHGRGDDRQHLSSLLTRLGVPEPVVLQETFSPGKTIPEKFESEASQSDAAIALFTPDDFGAARLDIGGGTLTQDAIRSYARARQNVALEYGWFWGRLGRTRVLFLLKGELELPSDVVGIAYEHYVDSVEEVEEAIAAFVNRIRGVNY